MWPRTFLQICGQLRYPVQPQAFGGLESTSKSNVQSNGLLKCCCCHCKVCFQTAQKLTLHAKSTDQGIPFKCSNLIEVMMKMECILEGSGHLCWEVGIDQTLSIPPAHQQACCPSPQQSCAIQNSAPGPGLHDNPGSIKKQPWTIMPSQP